MTTVMVILIHSGLGVRGHLQPSRHPGGIELHDATFESGSTAKHLFVPLTNIAYMEYLEFDPDA